MMKRTGWAILAAALCLALTTAAFAQKAPDVQQYQACKYCGMDREQFGHARLLIEYDDGSSTGACSIHCAAVDFAMNLDKAPKSMKVGEYGSKKLIDAEAATWVLGGSKPGVMTKRAKWAFEKKEDAEAFTKENGGELVTFDRAMQATFEDMYADTKMIQERRKAKRTSTQKPPESHEHQHGQPEQPKKQ